MKLWTYLRQEPPRGKMIWYPRLAFDLYRGPEHGERSILAGHIEFVLSKPTTEFGFSFEVGTRGSETPFDGHLKFAGTTIYWGIKQGGRLADLITQRWLTRNRMHRACLNDTCTCPPKYPRGQVKQHPNGDNRYDGRQVKAYTYEGRLYLQIWTRKDGWTRGEFAEWRSRSVKLNPLDVLLGERRYWYEDVASQRIVIDMPEAVYPVQATLQRQTYGRPKGRKTQSWTVDVRADECKGIPNRYDSSGGWKGDRVWGFGVGLKQGHRPDWHVDAKAAIESRILQNRADSGFRQPQPIEDAG